MCLSLHRHLIRLANKKLFRGARIFSRQPGSGSSSLHEASWLMVKQLTLLYFAGAAEELERAFPACEPRVAQNVHLSSQRMN